MRISPVRLLCSMHVTIQRAALTSVAIDTAPHGKIDLAGLDPDRPASDGTSGTFRSLSLQSLRICIVSLTRSCACHASMDVLVSWVSRTESMIFRRSHTV